MCTEVPAEQLAQVIDAVADEVLADCDVGRPPVDAVHLAQLLGLEVARDRSSDVRARFVRLGHSTGSTRGTILLADESRPERRQWAVAHEVGESVAHRVFGRLGISLVEIAAAARERVANLLASALLLPRQWLSTDGAVLEWDLLELKQRYSTASHELIARRMLEMTPPVIVTLFDQGQPQWRRSNARRPPPLTVAEREIWQVAHQQGSPAACADFELPDGIEQVRCWPIHEPDWRREILRTDLVAW